jgi:signal transduction histidine kinase
MATGSGTLLPNIAYRLDHPAEKLNQIKKRMYWFALALMGLVTFLSVACQFVQVNEILSFVWINTFTHSLLESYCGLISLTISYIIYKEYRESGRRSSFYLLMAFLSMAVFDFAHAYSNDSISLFVWFHTLSAVSGGAFFLWTAMTLGKNVRDARWQQRLLLVSGVLALAGAIVEVTHLLPILPDAVSNETNQHVPVTVPFVWYFSRKLVVVNLLATLCFLSAGVIFFRRFRATNDILYFVFSLASLLFFESELLFAFSNIWNMTWWYWHLIKLMIFVGLSIGLAHGLVRTFHELYESRQKLSATVDELMRAYDHLKNTQEELLESEKLASIGKMAAVISHEIRNPLAAIKNSAGIFKRHALLSPDDRELLGIIGKEINRLDGFITDFLEFAKPHPLQMTMTSLNSVIEETAALLAHYDQTGGSIRIVRSLDPLLPDVMIDRNAVKQVVWNILINAVQAMPDGGILTIMTSCKPQVPDGPPRGEATIAVTDTGRGMTAETIKKAFQPFFSTKTKGTGLGLSIVERVIRQHGGRVSVESAQGRGTTVLITMPLHSKESTIAEAMNHVVHLDSR